RTLDQVWIVVEKPTNRDSFLGILYIYIYKYIVDYKPLARDKFADKNHRVRSTIGRERSRVERYGTHAGNNRRLKTRRTIDSHRMSILWRSVLSACLGPLPVSITFCARQDHNKEYVHRFNHKQKNRHADPRRRLVAN